jgi:hypothetical protein
MSLSAKQMHKLRKVLYKLYPNGNEATFYLTTANIQNVFVDTNRNAWMVWGDVLEALKSSKDKMIQLLKTMLDRNDVPELRYFYTELESSRRLRLLSLAEALIMGRCVLFLGPEVLKVREGGVQLSFNEWIARKLQERMENDNVYFDKGLNTNLSYMANCYKETPNYMFGDIAALSNSEFKSLLAQQRIGREIYEQMAMLPLRIVINANPDDLLCNYINQRKADSCRLNYYDISSKEEARPQTEALSGLQVSGSGQVTAPQTVVYNIFGSFHNESSILHTEGEFLDFISRVTMGNPRLDNNLLAEFNEKDSYLFLGFDFEQWYFKVLFHLFKIKKDEFNAVSCSFDAPGFGAANPLPANGRISVRTKEFFEEEFKMFFVSDDLQSFITDLNALLANYSAKLI